MMKIDFSKIVTSIASRREHVRYDFQEYGLYLAEKLQDLSHKALYIKLAKSVERQLLVRAYDFAAIVGREGNKGRLFMWKLKMLKLEPIAPVPLYFTMDSEVDRKSWDLLFEQEHLASVCNRTGYEDIMSKKGFQFGTIPNLLRGDFLYAYAFATHLNESITTITIRVKAWERHQGYGLLRAAVASTFLTTLEEQSTEILTLLTAPKVFTHAQPVVIFPDKCLVSDTNPGKLTLANAEYTLPGTWKVGPPLLTNEQHPTRIHSSTR